METYEFFHVMMQQRGKLATFMPKPFSNLTGNGCHLQISLWDPAGQTNPLDDPSDPRGSRFEHRSIDGSANPYLAAVAVLGSSLDDIARGLDPGADSTANLYTTPLEEFNAYDPEVSQWEVDRYLTAF